MNLARTRSRSTLQRLLIAATTLAPFAAAQGQGLQWLKSPNSGLWFAETLGPMSWTGAEALAQKFGGHLATVRDANDNAWLDTTFFSALSLYRHHWIGLHQNTSSPNYSEPNGGWRWSSGEPLQFSNWAPGQPDDAGLGQNFGRTAGRDANASHEWFDETDLARPGFGGDNDLYIAPGEIKIFNTASSYVTFSQIQFVSGTDDATYALPIVTRLVEGGVLDVDDLYISPGATLKVEGPFALVVLARGRVIVHGKLVCDGNSNSGVISLDTSLVPALGSAGQAGGGRGGNGNPSATSANFFGADGEGAFGALNQGGRGGETGWSLLAADGVRRGAGGGGGVLGANVLAGAGMTGVYSQVRVGLDAESGFDNLDAHNGAASGPGPAHGGAAAGSPFRDGDPSNDFYGRSVDSAGVLRIGELIRPWAGSGGGGGGNASRVVSGTFPNPWAPQGDERGSGGGGGGGSCHILALDRIVFGANGQISARGGTGGGGENQSFLNRVGGGSGGGSGGHVVLQSAIHIDLRANPGVNWSSPIDNRWAVDTRGGQGGAGEADLGGATFGVNGPLETVTFLDACPPGHPVSGPNSCRGHVDGAGGDGGPGIVQFHTPTGIVGTNPLVADILVAPSVSLDRLTAPAPLFAGSSTSARLVVDIGPGVGLLELESDDCDANGVPDSYELEIGVAIDTDHDGIIDACDPALSYCFGAASVNNCALSMNSTGVASATASSGFELVISSVDGQRAGSIFFGLAPTYAPFGNHAMCVTVPRQRLGTHSSGGTTGQCNGELRTDWNAWRAAHPNGLGSPYAAGQTLYAQGWIREPSVVSKLALSSAHRFVLAP